MNKLGLLIDEYDVWPDDYAEKLFIYIAEVRLPANFSPVHAMVLITHSYFYLVICCRRSWTGIESA